jgi:hypothetical protein
VGRFFFVLLLLLLLLLPIKGDCKHDEDEADEAVMTNARMK